MMMIVMKLCTFEETISADNVGDVISSPHPGDSYRGEEKVIINALA